MAFENMTPFTEDQIKEPITEEQVPQTEETPQVSDVTTPEVTEPTEPTTDTPSQETPVDTFFEEYNKRYGTTYKSDEEIKNVLSLAGKATEYETKYKDYDTLKGDAEKYKQELEEVKSTHMSDLLSKPRLRSAYIAEQLVAKYPDRDPDVLASVAMSDLDKMSDLDVLARERKIRGSKSSLDNIKAVIMKELGIDPEQNPEEWDSLINTEIEMKATDARERINTMLKDIELPKVVTKEEREALATRTLEDKRKQATPFKEIFTKFDVYKNGDFEFTPPDEFKSKLGDVFDSFFIDSGLEINESNLATAEMIKKALFVEEYLPKMLEVHEKQVQAKLKEEQDKLLHNDTPPNTATATDQGAVESDNSGVSTFLRNRQDDRARRF